MIHIRNETGKFLPEPWLLHAHEYILGRERGDADAETSLFFTDDATTREYNRRYRSVDRTTDVLSFPADIPGAPVLGDILINLDWVDRSTDPAVEIRTLFVHGMLHLLGYDHLSASGETAMYARQSEYLEALTPCE
jgi:probable rRNA maturation factor